jgi:hypothetical protein
MELATRSYFNAGLALTTAATIAFTPAVLYGAPPLQVSLPHVSTTPLTLTAKVTSADVKALVENLDAAMSSASDTVANLAGLPGQTIVQALSDAANLNDDLWNRLISATPNPALQNMLAALRAVTRGGLTQLGDTVSTINTDITLSIDQFGTLLTSVVTGWIGTVGQAITNVLHDPFAAASYIGLLSVPLDMTGLGLTDAIIAADHLGANALSATNTVITGITAQISNAVSGLEKLVDAAADLTGTDLIEGVTTAAQGVVSAVVMASVAGVNGVSDAATSAATDVLHDLAGGASALVGTWVGNGTSDGALQNALAAIGSAPLDGASYTAAMNVVVGAAIHSGAVVVQAAGSLVSIPFSTGARLTTAAANVITSLVSGVATASSGVLQAMGLGPVMSNLPYGVATVVNGAVQVAAAATAAGLNTIAKAIDIGSAVTGVVTGTQALTHTLRGGTDTAAGKSTKAAATTTTTDTAAIQAKGADSESSTTVLAEAVVPSDAMPPSSVIQTSPPGATENGAATISTKGTDVADDSTSGTHCLAAAHAPTAGKPTNASAGSKATKAEPVAFTPVSATTRADATTAAKHAASDERAASPAAGSHGRKDAPRSGDGGRHGAADAAMSAPAATHVSGGRRRAGESAVASHGSAAAAHSAPGK